MKTAKGLLVGFVFALLSGCSNAKPHTIQWVHKPCIKPLTDYDYHTCGNLQVIIDGQALEIQKGFITDLASIPKPLWPILAPQYSGFVYPAILHDFLYRCPDNIDRKYADDLFYYALKSEGVGTYTAFKMWLGVRTFGRSHFADQTNCKYNYYFEAEADHVTLKG